MTLRTPIIRSKTLYVSSTVFRDLCTLALLRGDPGEVTPDEIADEVLRKALDAVPEFAAVRDGLDSALREFRAQQTRTISAAKLQPKQEGENPL